MCIVCVWVFCAIIKFIVCLRLRLRYAGLRYISKLNQMHQCTCYLKKSEGPPHQITAILPVLQKEGCIWQYGPSDRNHHIDVAATEQLVSRQKTTFFSNAKNLEAFALFSAMDLAQKIGFPIGTSMIQSSVNLTSSHQESLQSLFY